MRVRLALARDCSPALFGRDMIQAEPLIAHLQNLILGENGFKHRYPNFIPVCKSLIEALHGLDKIQTMDGFKDTETAAEIASDAMLDVKKRLLGRSSKRT